MSYKSLNPIVIEGLKETPEINVYEFMKELINELIASDEANPKRRLEQVLGGFKKTEHGTLAVKLLTEPLLSKLAETLDESLKMAKAKTGTKLTAAAPEASGRREEKKEREEKRQEDSPARPPSGHR